MAQERDPGQGYILIDTSGAHLSVAASVNGKTEYVYEENCGINHSVKVMPAVKEVLERTGGGVKDADFIGVVTGAGSFTGIRIGIATGKGLAFPYGIPLLGITSFDTIAYNIYSGKVLAVIDAGHGGYYVSGYDDLKNVLSPRYILKEELKPLAKEYKFLSYNKIDGLKTKVVSPLKGLISFAEKNGEKAQKGGALLPTYCRKSQAEEGR